MHNHKFGQYDGQALGKASSLLIFDIFYSYFVMTDEQSYSLVN